MITNCTVRGLGLSLLLAITLLLGIATAGAIAAFRTASPWFAMCFALATLMFAWIRQREQPQWGGSNR